MPRPRGMLRRALCVPVLMAAAATAAGEPKPQLPAPMARVADGGQMLSTAHGAQMLPVSNGAQMLPVTNGAQMLPVTDGAQMLRDVQAMAAQAGPQTGRPVLSSPVLLALGRVPRDQFVPAAVRDRAWLNQALPIGAGQTISQPYIVALMSDLLEVGAGARVLEVGTGSGYQAAVLAEMGITVYSIEIIEALAREAAARLQRLGYASVTVRAGDGYHGWPQHAPFDAIIVTAAAPEVPQPLVDQLASGGRLVIPVGPQDGAQHLLVIEKGPDGAIDTRQVLPVRFVPLTGAH